jgi:hypothetical protein
MDKFFGDVLLTVTFTCLTILILLGITKTKPKIFGIEVELIASFGCIVFVNLWFLIYLLISLL